MTTSQAELRSIAGELHEAWRALRKGPDGTYEPRVRPDGQGGELDIAATAFEDLPPRWQEENMAAARTAEAAVVQSVTLEEAAEHIHKAWLDRNFLIAAEEVRPPYGQTPEEEKAKDRQIALIVSRLTRRPLADPTHVTKVSA